ncbi:MAG: hypothetical protein MHM6MM_003701 [Cercozoa sp. M6MM]
MADFLGDQPWYEQQRLLVQKLREGEDALSEERAECVAACWANYWFLGARYPADLQRQVEALPRPSDDVMQVQQVQRPSERQLQQSLQEAGEDTTGYLQRTYGPESEYVRSLDETKQRQQQRDHRAYQARSQYGQYPPQQQGQYQRHPPQGYQQQGYPLQGYPPQSYPPQSCPPQGYQQRQQQPPMYQLQQQQQASGYQPQHPHYQQQQPQQRGYQGHSGHYAQHYGDRRQQRPY